MPTVQVTDGSSAVTSTSTKNDAGTVVKGGTPESASPLQNVLNLNDLKTMDDLGGGVYGAKVVTNNGTGGSTSDPDGVQAVKSGGTAGFAYTPARGERNFIIKGASSADGGAGLVNKDAMSVLAMPASEISLRGVVDTHGIIGTVQQGEAILADGSTSTNFAKYEILARPSTEVVPGRTKGADAGAAATYVNPVDGTPAVATEIFPTRSVPGELTFMFGAAKPTNVADSTDKNYKAIDSNE